MSYFQSPIVIGGRQQIPVNAASVSPVLEPGVYDVWAAADTYIRVSEDLDTTGLFNTTGYLIPGGAGIISVRIAGNNKRIGTTAALSIHRVE